MSGPAVLTAGGLTLIRAANGGHRIELRDADNLVACFESIEPVEPSAAENANWPASPPVQEWHDEARAGATALMAVGRAGRSHWSLSCEVTADGHATFDVAARISERPLRLGSSYLLCEGTPQDLVPAQKQRLGGSLALPETVSANRLQFAGGWQLAVDSLTTLLRYNAETRTVTIEPAPAPAASWPQTIRWRYSFERFFK
ncbi:MAG TPA: hypothetical protein VGJ26_09085 [Pirellulales bacterium]